MTWIQGVRLWWWRLVSDVGDAINELGSALSRASLDGITRVRDELQAEADRRKGGGA